MQERSALAEGYLHCTPVCIKIGYPLIYVILNACVLLHRSYVMGISVYTVGAWLD